MEYRCPVDDRIFETATDQHKPGLVIRGKDGAADTFAPGHENGGHPDCNGPACMESRAKGKSPQPDQPDPDEEEKKDQKEEPSKAYATR